MLRTLTFGDLDSGLWGAVWELGDRQPGFALAGDTEAFASPQVVLTDGWLITGDGIELESSASGEPAEVAEGYEQLMRVTGRMRIAGADRMVECLGRRGERRMLDAGSCESVRDVSAWFAADDGIALVAARPPGSPGHEGDLVTASAFESGRPLPIADSRLSTTYGADGSPVRAGVELWLEEATNDEEHDEQKERVLHPRRAAGEAAGKRATTAAGSLAAEARLFRWHARGLDGAGVYLLVRSR